MIPNDLNYNQPLAVYLLFGAIGIFTLFCSLYAYRKSKIHFFALSKILTEILIPRSRYNFWAKALFFSIAWALATLSLMEPRGNGHYPLESGIAKQEGSKEKEDASLQRRAHDVIFLVDASASMEVKDTRLKLSRLEYAKEIVDQIIAKLKGESVALYAFTSDTTRLSPPTMDYLFVRLMLRDLHINEGDIAGTNLLEAISDMRSDYFKNKTPILKTLVILTDGEDTDIKGMQGKEKEEYTKKILNLLKDSEENHLTVFTIGMGTAKGEVIPGMQYGGKPVVSSLDVEILKRIADSGKGKYYFANDWTAFDLSKDLADIIDQENAPLEDYKVKLGRSETKGGDDLIYDLYFQIPLGICILLLSFGLFFPETRLRKKETR